MSVPILSFSGDLERALRLAVRLHDGHFRKTDRTLPYITHLFHVALILQGHGFPRSVILAAILHDTLEDTDYTYEEMLHDFGDDVTSIVCTVTEDKHLRWEERKRKYLEQVRSGSHHAKAVCCADKIHNLSTILEEYRIRGEDLWKVFSRGRGQTFAFYESCYEVVSDGWNHPVVDAYRTVMEDAREVFDIP